MSKTFLLTYCFLTRIAARISKHKVLSNKIQNQIPLVKEIPMVYLISDILDSTTVVFSQIYQITITIQLNKRKPQKDSSLDVMQQLFDNNTIINLLLNSRNPQLINF